jgi:hypothetical protein
MMNSVIRYFDLNQKRRPTSDAEAASDDSKPLPWQLQYLALLLGIIVQPYFAYYQQHGQWVLTAVPGWIIFSIIVALVCFPGVYKKSFDPGQPMIMQVIPIFTAGLGWQSLFTTVVKTAS